LAKSKRREITKERHKQEIIEAALYLFGKKGYKDTTIEEIAEHAQFSKGAIYSYFESKKELFNEILKELFDKVQAFAEEAKNLKGDAKEKLRVYALNVSRYFLLESRHSFNVMMQAIMQMNAEDRERTKNYVMRRIKQINQILSDIFVEDIKDGKLKNFNPSLIVMTFNGILRDLIYGCLLENLADLTPEKIVDVTLEIIFDGISKNK
jgi:AcrR family transcriptional regulator